MFRHMMAHRHRTSNNGRALAMKRSPGSVTTSVGGPTSWVVVVVVGGMT